MLFDDALLEKIADRIMEIPGKENTVLPMLRKQYADIQRGIDNLLNAIQQGIITSSTKQRLEDLEKQKNDISVQIIKEEMSKPLLTKEQILFWFHRFRKYNTRRLDHKRRLIDSFINTIYLYSDKMVIAFNYKDGAETISLSEIENSDLSSDLTASALPKILIRKNGDFYFLPLTFSLLLQNKIGNGIFGKVICNRRGLLFFVMQKRTQGTPESAGRYR